MADIILKTPTGCLTSSWLKAADAGKIQERSGSKGTVKELARAAGGEYTDDFATDPFSAPARLTNMLPGLWYGTGGYIRTPVGTTTSRCYFNELGDFTNIIMKAKFWRDYNRSNHGLYGRINSTTGTGYGIYIDDSQLVIYLYKSTGAGEADRTLLDSESFDVSYGWVWLKLSLQGTTIKGKVWRDGDSEPTTGGPDNDGYQLKATDSDYSSGKLGFYSYEWHALHYTKVDDFTSDSGAFPDTSPALYCEWDGGVDEATWANALVFKQNPSPVDNGSIQVRVGYSNTQPSTLGEAVCDALLGDLKTPDGNGEVTGVGGTGRWRVCAFPFNSNGTQQTALPIFDGGQDITVKAGGAARPVLLHSNVLGG
jgi:hypothetical protein